MSTLLYSGKSVGIDRHSSSETCLKIVNHCSADIIVVDKPHQLEKILRVNIMGPIALIHRSSCAKVISEMTSVKKLVYSHRTNTKDLDGSKFVKVRVRVVILRNIFYNYISLIVGAITIQW